ncbi:MAG: hypothetical protein AAF996_08890 [Pseudomonadota bacterium]
MLHKIHFKEAWHSPAAYQWRGLGLPQFRIAKSTGRALSPTSRG